jgi:pyruvate/2-oxoglutarate dehydrogenase complex dihydrolipoamide dehydrogenase (E3) component/uncharacterized membrane protein YdjX (TVP38/TMEM64 family)
MQYDYDVIVVWSWSGGLTVSIGLAAAGKKVALVEKWLIGWDCTNFWCVPSKALIDIAKWWDYKDLKDALAQVRARRKLIQDEETIEKIEKYWMKIIQGFASFKDSHTILIDWKKEISWNKIVLSTGSHAVWCPELEWADKEDILTNETIFELNENIKKLIVVWGGYIGCELAESFANIWIDVTIIQRNTRLIPREEMESSEILQSEFEKKWMTILTNTLTEKVEWKTLFVKNKDTWKIEEIAFDKILVALGRKANINWLELEKTWIENDKGWIIVDKYNSTNIKNIFAIWDCVSGNPQFTHWANNEGRGVVRNIIVPFPKSSTRWAVLPAVLYTNLEVARVGKTTEELEKKLGKDGFHTEMMNFEHNDRSKLTEDETGFIKIHFSRLGGKVLWASIVWKWAGEMLPVLISAMQNKLSGYKMAKIIYPYPTKAELIKKVSDKFVVHTLKNIKIEILHFFKSNLLQISVALLWISIFWLFLIYKNATWLSVEELFFALYNFIVTNAFYGPLIFIVAYVLRPLLLLPGSFATIMAWALFGFWPGLVYLLIWAILSADFFYVLWKIFWKKMLQDEWNWVISSLKTKCDESPFMAILMTRLLFLPYDLINIASWVLKVDFKAFNIATLIWIIPWSAVFIYAGTAFYGKELTSFSDVIENIDISTLLYAWVAFLLVSLWAKFLKKKYGK